MFSIFNKLRGGRSGVNLMEDADPSPQFGKLVAVEKATKLTTTSLKVISLPD
jgi:hypothetical protein